MISFDFFVIFLFLFLLFSLDFVVYFFMSVPTKTILTVNIGDNVKLRFGGVSVWFLFYFRPESVVPPESLMRCFDVCLRTSMLYSICLN